jgi:HEAT repeat protein
MRNSCVLLTLAMAAFAQDAIRPKDVRDMAKDGSSAIPKLAELLKNQDVEIRREAVKAIAEIGTQHSLDPLVAATRDNDPEVQIRATDGLVNFYLPGYLRTGFGATLRRAGTSIRGRFTDTNDQIIDAYIQPRPDVVEALGKLARGGVTMDVRANAARAAGILRGKEAIPDLLEAVRTKDSTVLYEALIAFQKIRDQSAGPKLTFLVRDLDPKVQVAAIETAGLLLNKEAVPELVYVLGRTDDRKVRRAALTSLAMLPDEASRRLFERYLVDKDERMRGAAAEGLGRLNNPDDMTRLASAYQSEKKTSPRLSLAFAQVALGNHEISELSPLQYLVNTLNSTSYRGEAFAFLVELARTPEIRTKLYTPLTRGSKDERIHLSRVMARSGDESSFAALEQLQKDSDPEVANEALSAARSLRTRLGL